VNLLGNAVKFTERGSVSLTVSGGPAEPGRWNIRFTIRDTGIGMSAEQVSRLFQKFAQADSSAARKYGGTGLGLAISRRLADLMGGSIHALSSPGVGSTFHFQVALPAAEAPGGKTQTEIAAPPRTAGVRILLAEDNPINVRVAQGLLGRLGYSLAVASNGREAVEAVERESYDIVFMDCMMPEVDGFEATRLIRRRSGPVPVIIAMTANAMEGDRDRCLAAGMDDYLAKPLVLKELADCLEKWTRAAAGPRTHGPR
jgi:CheY-like chemotaxis protein